jgi:signal transduction histidine kinase
LAGRIGRRHGFRRPSTVLLTGVAVAVEVCSLVGVTVRDWAIDAAFAIGAAVLLVFWATRIADSWGGGYWQLGCVAGAVVCGIALLRRKGRMWATIAGLACALVAMLVAWSARLPAEPGPAMALGLSVLLGSAIRVLRPFPASVLAAAALLPTVAGALAFQRSGGIPAVTVLNLAGWLAAVGVGVGRHLVGVRRQTVAEGVRRDERLALARELHDVVAHHVTGIVLQTQAARIIRRKNPAELDDALDDIETAGSEALVAMRRVVGLLRDDADATGAAPGIRPLGELVDRFAKRGGQEVQLQLPEPDLEWRPELASTVYRIVQEALTNISRHAPTARSVRILVAQNQKMVSVEVVDDGHSRHVRRLGYGLIGIRERVEALDGSLTAGPRPEGGWSVAASLPVVARRSG